MGALRIKIMILLRETFNKFLRDLEMVRIISYDTIRDEILNPSRYVVYNK
jgi:hypothetical protein